MAFEIAHQVFADGKDLVHFVESLTEHFRNLLMVKLSGKNAPSSLSPRPIAISMKPRPSFTRRSSASASSIIWQSHSSRFALLLMEK